MPESAFVAVALAAGAGLAASIGIEQCLLPRPSLARPYRSWALHTGIWLLTYGALLLPLGRPWFAASGVSALLLLLVLVNNAKMKALREPFVFPDYEYFTDALRHPRLYLPFLGWPKALAAALGFALAVAGGLGLETAPAERFAVSGQLGGVLAVLAGGTLLLAVGSWPPLPVCFLPRDDVLALGLLASLWRYAGESRQRPVVTSPFSGRQSAADTTSLPHLVAVQSESFFDPRPLYAGIRHDVLAAFDQLAASGLAGGALSVPAWGANTVRTEFAFLSGIDESQLGAHRFNPYHAVAAGWDVPSLASFLKQLGYRTVCVHPYPASFYRRNRVYPQLGFDVFIDLDGFADAPRFGPYVSDAAVAQKIAACLAESSGPLFVFAITMENHGPLHLEQADAADAAEFYATPPPAGCDDLTIFLRHLRNADRMIATLQRHLQDGDRPTGLCWFGDHVPIMPAVYRTFGVPEGETRYVLWATGGPHTPATQTLAAHQLALHWLRSLRLIDPLCEPVTPPGRDTSINPCG